MDATYEDGVLQFTTEHFSVYMVAKVENHIWNNGEITKAATCTEDGSKTYTCQNCGETKAETINKLGHSYISVVTAPTCTAEGYTTYTCSRCGDSYVDKKVAATGHSWNNGEVTKAATCTEDGSKTYKCQNCGETKTETINKLGHSYTSVVTAPTCTAEGYTTYTCSRCGDSYVDKKVAATGHSWNNGEVTKAATCTEDGSKTYTCQNCGETKTETINKLGHSYTSVVTAPTCTAEGYTTHTCSRCGDSYVDKKVAATGHSWDNGKVTKAATCTEDGSKTYKCQNCGETKTETINKLGHSYTSVVTAPTCTAEGYTTYTCSRCGNSYVDTAVAVIEHSWDNGTVTKAATTSETGVMTYTCKVCGKTRTEEIAKLGTAAMPFTDVPENEYYTQPVAWAVAQGVTTGTSATTFSPNSPCTRSQVVTFLWRAAGSPEPTTTANPFADVKAGQFYYKAVLWAVENGITTGVSATAFKPDDVCTRSQVVTFLWRFAGKPAVSTDSIQFTDVKAGTYYEQAVAWAISKEITNGVGNNSFAPNATCTRSQIVTFLWRDLAK
jgi:cytochrome c2